MPFLSGVWGYVIAAAGAALAAASLSIWLTHAVMVHQIDKLKIAHQNEIIKAQQLAAADQARRDKISHDADVAYAFNHQKIVTVTHTIIEKVPVYVTQKIDATYPVPCALVRVWDAAVLSTSPDALSYGPGLADDKTCPVSASALANAGVKAIRSYTETSDQLISLQDWITKQGAANHP